MLQLGDFGVFATSSAIKLLYSGKGRGAWGRSTALSRVRAYSRAEPGRRPGKVHVSSILAVLGIVGCKPVVTPSLEGEV